VNLLINPFRQTGIFIQLPQEHPSFHWIQLFVSHNFSLRSPIAVFQVVFLLTVIKNFGSKLLTVTIIHFFTPEMNKQMSFNSFDCLTNSFWQLKNYSSFLPICFLTLHKNLSTFSLDNKILQKESKSPKNCYTSTIGFGNDLTSTRWFLAFILLSKFLPKLY